MGGVVLAGGHNCRYLRIYLDRVVGMAWSIDCVTLGKGFERVNIGGGLSFVTGPMGSGKSLFGTRKIIARLCEGKYVLTNIALLPGWENVAARHVLRYSPLSWHKEKLLAEKFRSHYVFLDTFEDATFFSPPIPKGAQREGRAALVWDEVHNDMNNRDWMESSQKLVMKWATQLRKLGFEAYFLSQHSDNTDVALRRVCNYQIRLQNQREQTRLLGMRVTPWPLFLASWYPANIVHGRRTEPVKIERYFLSWHRRIYDTLALYHGLHQEHLANTKLFQLPEGGLSDEVLLGWKMERRKERAMRDAEKNPQGKPAKLVSLNLPRSSDLTERAG
jgi:hypothetical protein